MRTIISAAVGAVTLVGASAAAPTSAATYLAVNNSSPAVCTGAAPVCNFTLVGQVDRNGPFSVTSAAFGLPTTGIFAGVATNTATNTTNIDFTGVTLTNGSTGRFYTGVVQNGFFDLAFVGPASVARGMFTLTLVGNATVKGGIRPSYPSIGGTAAFSAAPAPEPAAWALLIVGFGTIGAALRRRSGKAGSGRAQLIFA